MIVGLPFGLMGRGDTGVLIAGASSMADIQVGDLVVVFQARGDTVSGGSSPSTPTVFPTLPTGFTNIQTQSAATSGQSGGINYYGYASGRISFCIATTSQIGQTIENLRFIRSYRNSKGLPLERLSLGTRNNAYSGGAGKKPLGFLQAQLVAASASIPSVATVDGISFTPTTTNTFTQPVSGTSGTYVGARWAITLGNLQTNTNVLNWPSGNGGVWGVSVK